MLRSRTLFAVLPLLLLSLASCKKEARMVQEAPMESQAAPLRAPAGESAEAPAQNAAAAPGKPAAPRAIARKLVRTVDLVVQVRDTEKAADEVRRIAERLGGYLGTVDAQRRDGLFYYQMTIRVPVERLDEALKAVKGLAARIDREQQQVQDVTDQFVDLDARLRTLQATERELTALLAESRQRERKVDEIMAVYRELTEIRTQIEQIQGQLNALDKLATLSTVNVQLVPTEAARPVAEVGWSPGDTARGSVRFLIVFFQRLVDFLIVAAIVLVPALALLVGFFIFVRRVWRRLKPGK